MVARRRRPAQNSGARRRADGQDIGSGAHPRPGIVRGNASADPFPMPDRPWRSVPLRPQAQMKGRRPRATQGQRISTRAAASRTMRAIPSSTSRAQVPVESPTAFASSEVHHPFPLPTAREPPPGRFPEETTHPTGGRTDLLNWSRQAKVVRAWSRGASARVGQRTSRPAPPTTEAFESGPFVGFRQRESEPLSTFA